MSVLYFFTLSKLEAQSCGVAAVYGGGPIYLHDTTTIPELRASGFTTVVVWTIHINTAGDLNFNAEFLAVSNGQYVGHSVHPNFPANMALLKTQPTSVNRIEFGLSASGSSTFANIKTIITAQGTGPTSILYKNFKALKDSIPSVDAINFDDESTYNVASSVQFSVMLADLGYKVTLCPYTSSSYWTSVATQTNTQRPGTVDAIFLQCYSGGSFNSPCSGWNFGSIPIYPGLWDSNNTPAQIHTKMTSWKTQCGIKGGFMWLYDDFYGTTKTAQYAAAVTLTTAPNISAMSTTTCSGVGFTATPVNGVNGTVPTGTTYSWSAPTGINISGGVADTGSVIKGTLKDTSNSLATAIYTITPTANGCSGNPFTYTVNVHPAYNSLSNLSVCHGDSIVVGTHIYNTSGIYIDSLKTTSGCDSIITTNLFVNPIPIVLANNDTICFGKNATLTASGASTYVWLADGIVVSDSNTINVSPVLTTTYYIIGKDTNACVGNDSAIVTVNPLPATPVISLSGNTLTSNANTGNQWYNLATGVLNNDTSQTFMPQQIGDYYVIVTLNDGCSSDTSNVIHYDNTGINNIANKIVLSVYPNPVKELLTIQTNAYNSNQRFEITTLIGQTVYTSTINNKAIVNTSAFANGVYILKIFTEKETEVRKFVKE
jgi:PKD-like domain/Secretion system C-terminal sorting domain/Ig-like domain CHU_C associated